VLLPLWKTIGLVLILFPALTLARESMAPYSLQATPSICVAREPEDSCNMQLNIQWQGPMADEVCLHLAQNDEPLQCWQRADEGQLMLAFHSAEDVTLQLLNAADGTVLQQISISVVSRDVRRDVRDTRRRRRHIWSIL